MTELQWHQLECPKCGKIGYRSGFFTTRQVLCPACRKAVMEEEAQIDDEDLPTA